ncbi:MAG: CHAD domain-containing protein [Methanoregulaceae archaeon]|nr:CHAD domain-containing protein [Methanoregulaceae archaeon]
MTPRDQDPDVLTYCEFGSLTLRRHLKALRSEVAGVSVGADSEAVHRMRVASRRLRASLLLFPECLPGPAYDRWRSEIRAITKSLGEARDLDVQIEFIDRYLPDIGSGPGNTAGIVLLRKQISRRRKKAQASVRKALSTLRSDKTVEGIRQALRRYPVGREKKEGPRYSPVLYERAFDIVVKRLLRVLSYEAAVLCHDCISEHHALRIDVKRLRYTLEAFAPLYPDGLKDRIGALREIQDLLGEMHDCDVWIAMLPPFLDSTAAGPDHLVPSGEDLTGKILLDRQERREACYREFRDAWDREKRHDSWSVLISSLATGGAISELDPLPEGAQIGIVGDLKGNPAILRAILSDCRHEGIGALVISGDLIGRGQKSGELIRLCRDEKIPVAPGSGDRKVIRKAFPAIPGSRPGKKSKRRRDVPYIPDTDGISFLCGLPSGFAFSVGNKRIWIDPAVSLGREPQGQGAMTEALMTAFPADVIVIGGPEFSLSEGGRLVVSPGPARDTAGTARYTVIRPDSLEVIRKEVAPGSK